MNDKGFTLKSLRRVFRYLYFGSIAKYIPRIFPKHPYTAVEFYVWSWLAIQILFFLYFLACPSLVNVCWIIIPVAILGIYRLFDIFQAWVSQFILMEDPNWIDIFRTRILVFSGYTETIVIYAILAYIFSANFSQPFNDISQSLYYSVTTATTIGSDWEPKTTGGYAMFYTQLMFSVFFVNAVLQQTFQTRKWKEIVSLVEDIKKSLVRIERK